MSQDAADPRVQVPFTFYRFAVRRERSGRVYSYLSAPVRAPTGQPERGAALLTARLDAGDTAPAVLTLTSGAPGGSGFVFRSGAVRL